MLAGKGVRLRGLLVAPVVVTLVAPRGAARAQSPSPGSCPPPVAAELRDEAQRFYAAGTASSLGEEWAEALPAFEEASRLDPGSVLAHFARGQALTALRRYPEAVRAYHDCESAFRCARALSQEQRAEARKRLKRQVAMLREEIRTLERGRLVEQSVSARAMPGSDAPRPSAGLARVHELEKSLHELERWLKADVEDTPPALSLALGNASFHAGDLDEAERAFRAALRADAGSGDAHNNLAVVLMLTGRAEEAAREVRLAEKAGVPPNPRLLEEIRKRRLEATMPRE